MAKNKARHILHGVLDCLPIILIPIFMIYSQNHEINDQSIEVQENKEVIFNQNVKNGNFENTTNWLNSGRVDFTVSDNVASIKPNANATNDNYLSQSIPMEVGHKYLLTADLMSYGTNINVITVFYGTTVTFNQIKSTSANTWESTATFFTPTDTTYTQIRLVNPQSNVSNVNYVKNVMLFDLTTIFGEGNEPITYNQFLIYFPNDYYNYTQYQIMFIQDIPITYNDTDIMSQSFYCLYNAVDKYFNMGNVFGMNNLYTWFETNIFGGTASPSIYIVWNIVLYEFIMDLLFLLYGLFMFFIDLCKRLMEKPLNSIK